jgi:type IX secretion system PorP/SprF family membrane protein
MCIFLALQQSYAQQDPQFTLFNFNPLTNNPATAGARSCLSATAQMRRQWVGLNGSPITINANVSAPIQLTHSAWGFHLSNDQIGVSKFAGVEGDYVYKSDLKEFGTLSIGARVSFYNYRNDLTQVTTVTPGDNAFMYNDNVMITNFGFGALWEREKFFIGVGVPHLLNNKLSEVQQNAKQTQHFYLQSGYSFVVNEHIDFEPNLQVKYAFGAPFQINANALFVFYRTLWLGANYRSDFSSARLSTSEGFSAVSYLYINKHLRVGFAYDQTISKLQSSQRGTYELLLGYDWIHKPLRMLTPRFF